MLITISPAKRLDLGKQSLTGTYTKPALLKDSRLLIERLRELSPQELSSLMSISPRLADENHQRYLAWRTPFTPANAKQAVLMFQGDVYQGLDASSYAEADFEFAQDHLRILSGLYGVLRPLDLIQPYRLEMGSRLTTSRGSNLYEFWGDKITRNLNKALPAQGDDVLVNLASNEYFKSVLTERLKGRVITPVFKEKKNGGFKVIGMFAKKARGLMSSYIIKNRLMGVEDIKNFDGSGYRYDKRHSSEGEWVFTRPTP